MPHVLCTIPTASPDLDGLAWTEADGGMLSPELSEAEAARYVGIPGFAPHDGPADTSPPSANPSGRRKAPAGDTTTA